MQSSLLPTSAINQVKQSILFTPILNRAARRFSSTAKQYDLAIVGGGPGGYVAAIRAGQLGIKTVCIEKRGALGGTCLNVGCIPSKILLNMSHKFEELKSLSKIGITTKENKVDISKMMSAKEATQKQLTQGIEFLFKKNDVDYIKGNAKLTSDKGIDVESENGEREAIEARNIILATGSESTPMPGGFLKIDEKVVLSSTGALKLQKIPKKMIVIGGGIIGLELGSVWNRLGSEVHVVEFLDQIANVIDDDMSKALQKNLEKKGIKFHLSSKVVGAEVKGESATIEVEGKGGKKTKMTADKLLVCVGRRPYSEGLGLEELGIEKDKMGRVKVEDGFRVPNKSSIYAIGDLVEGPMLAHKAEEDGVAVVEMLANIGSGKVNYEAVPNVVYTSPEIGGVGKTERQLKDGNIPYKKGIFSFAANSRAKVQNDTEGSVKVLMNPETLKILGAWIFGPSAGELIHSFAIAMTNNLTAKDLIHTCHAHPTLSEAIREACMAAVDKPIHG